MASKIQSKQSLNYNKSKLSPILDRYVDHFRTYHPRIKTCFLSTIDAVWSIALDFSTIKLYFDNLEEALYKPPSVIYNVNETGFLIRSSRKLVVLLD